MDTCNVWIRTSNTRSCAGVVPSRSSRNKGQCVASLTHQPLIELLLSCSTLQESKPCKLCRHTAAPLNHQLLLWPFLALPTCYLRRRPDISDPTAIESADARLWHPPVEQVLGRRPVKVHQVHAVLDALAAVRPHVMAAAEAGEQSTLGEHLARSPLGKDSSGKRRMKATFEGPMQSAICSKCAIQA